MQTWQTLSRWFLAAALAGGALALSTKSFADWDHPLNTTLEYWIPGPWGQDSFAGQCRVQTSLLKEPAGDVALIQPLHNDLSKCKPGSKGAWVQIVTFDGQNLVTGPKGFSTDDWPGMSVGPNGQAVFGAAFGAVNDAGYTHTWNVVFAAPL